MKDISIYIESELNISETLIQDGNGNVVDFMEDDDTLREFLILCKYADFFNSIEQHWHQVNKSTPVSRAIKSETDKLFKVCYKVFSMVGMSPSFDYERSYEKSIIYYYEDDYYKGKKLNTIIKRSDEWKEFYKGYKRFKNNEVDVKNHDSQLVNFMKQFVFISKDFVDDVQS